MKNAHKMLRVLEMVWLVIGCIGLISFAYAMIVGRKDQAIYFLVFTFVSGIMYAVRKRQRKRTTPTEENNNPTNNN